MYNNFSNYLGARRCDNKCRGIVGPQGPQGNGGPIGPYGSTGPQGATGIRGATGCGCRGATGAPGPPGPISNQSIVFLTSTIDVLPGTTDQFQQFYINATAPVPGSSITITFTTSSLVYLGALCTTITLPSSGTSVQLVWSTGQSTWYVISQIGATIA